MRPPDDTKTLNEVFVTGMVEAAIHGSPAYERGSLRTEIVLDADGIAQPCFFLWTDATMSRYRITIEMDPEQ
jgi:hypothetical protein